LPALEVLAESDPPWLHTDITPSDHFPQARDAFIAIALRDFFLQGQFSFKYGGIPREVVREASELRQLALGECRQGPELSRIKVGLYNVVVLRMLPFLRPGELESVWNELESGQCFQSLSPRENKWIALFKNTVNNTINEIMKILTCFILPATFS
jgi:hypothetical protein